LIVAASVLVNFHHYMTNQTKRRRKKKEGEEGEKENTRQEKCMGEGWEQTGRPLAKDCNRRYEAMAYELIQAEGLFEPRNVVQYESLVELLRDLNCVAIAIETETRRICEDVTLMQPMFISP
jgi:hypothetical protein